MSILVKQGGVWKPNVSPSVKRAGVFGEVQKAFHKSQGVWKQVYERYTGPPPVLFPITIPENSGPGPTTLMGQYQRPDGTGAHGFFGEVAASDFITGLALTNAIGLNIYGYEINTNTPWLKFYLDGKILFFPKKAIRNNVSWRSIYALGAVYGDGTNGTYPYPTNTPKPQTAQVVIKGLTYKIRLMRGVPAGVNAAGQQGVNQAVTIGSEWNRLMMNISDDTTTNLGQEGGKWANYTLADLNTQNTTPGCYTLCMDMSLVGTNVYRVGRGGTTLGIGFIGTADPGTQFNTYGWRPVLELIG